MELEQGGGDRAGYGEELVPRLSQDLTQQLGRGFGVVNLSYMRRFYLSWPAERIFQTVSEKLGTASPISDNSISPTALAKLQTPSGTGFTVLQSIDTSFPLPWSHYVKLLSVDDENARRFYEEEALRGGWSVRRQ